MRGAEVSSHRDHSPVLLSTLSTVRCTAPPLVRIPSPAGGGADGAVQRQDLRAPPLKGQCPPHKHTAPPPSGGGADGVVQR